MLKKIVALFLVVIAVMVGVSALINNQLQSFDWQEATEHTKKNQELQLEGKYRVFLPDFQQGKAWQKSIGKYNFLEPLLWNNEATLLQFYKEQELQSLAFEEQYQAQRSQAEEQYQQAKYDYLSDKVEAQADIAVYETLKKSHLLQFEAKQGEALRQKLVTLDQEMEEFRTHYQTTIAAITD